MSAVGAAAGDIIGSVAEPAAFIVGAVAEPAACEADDDAANDPCTGVLHTAGGTVPAAACGGPALAVLLFAAAVAADGGGVGVLVWYVFSDFMLYPGAFGTEEDFVGTKSVFGSGLLMLDVAGLPGGDNVPVSLNNDLLALSSM